MKRLAATATELEKIGEQSCKSEGNRGKQAGVERGEKVQWLRLWLGDGSLSILKLEIQL